MTTLRFGVLGLGRIGRIHSENLMRAVPGAVVTAAAEPDEENGRAWCRALDIGFFTTNPSEVLERDDVDAVVICSPTDTHASLMQAAAAAGKHIFCEKPISLSLEETKGTLEAVERSGVRLQLGFNRRFDHNFSKIRQLVQSGSLGQVEQVTITSRDPEPPPISYVKVSGGIFRDMSIHDFDMARYITGSEVDWVYAVGSCMVDPAIGEAGDYDSAVITLQCRSGAVVVIQNSRRSAYGYDQRLEVFGSEGSAEAGNDTATNVQVRTEGQVASDPPLYFFLERYMDSFTDEMKAFAEAMREDKELPVSGQDGLAALRIAEAALQSVAEKRPVAVKADD